MNVPLAWRNAADKPLRTVLSTAGVSVALLLVYMQVCFYDTGVRSASLAYGQLDFDLLLVSPQYVHLRFPGRIPRRYLERAKQCRGVARATPLYIGGGDFRQPGHGARHEVMVVGVDAATQPFLVPRLQTCLQRLTVPETTIVDRTMIGKNRPSLRPGEFLELEGHRLLIRDTYAYGPGLMADAELIVSVETMEKVFPWFSSNSVSIGLLNLDPGADFDRVVRELQALLAPNVVVWTREQVKANDEKFMMRNKPLGILFISGVVLGLTVGAIVVYQVLATAVITQSSEYAAMQAVGYSRIQIHGIVFQQALLYVVLALPPATALAYAVCRIMQNVTQWPFELTGKIILLVSLLAIAKCGISGVLVIGKLQRSDPADLFV